MYHMPIPPHDRHRSPDNGTGHRCAVESYSPLPRTILTSMKPRPNHSATLRAELARAKIAASGSRTCGPSKFPDRAKRRFDGRVESPSTKTGLPVYDRSGLPPGTGRRRLTSGGTPHFRTTARRAEGCVSRRPSSTKEWPSDAFYDERTPRADGVSIGRSATSLNGSNQSVHGTVRRPMSARVSHANHTGSVDEDSDADSGDRKVWSSGRGQQPAAYEERRYTVPRSGRGSTGTGGGQRDGHLSITGRKKPSTVSRSCSGSCTAFSGGVCARVSGLGSPESRQTLVEDIKRLQDCAVSMTSRLSTILLRCMDDVADLDSLDSPVWTHGACSIGVNHANDRVSTTKSGNTSDDGVQLSIAVTESHKTALVRGASDDCSALVNEHEDRSDAPRSEQDQSPPSRFTADTRLSEWPVASAIRNFTSISETYAGQPKRQKHGGLQASASPMPPQRRKSDPCDARVPPSPAHPQRQRQASEAAHHPSPLVCEQYEYHMCPSSRSRSPGSLIECRERHGGRSPYYWRVHRAADDAWFPLANGVEVERAFCDPRAETFSKAVTQDGHRIELNFISMTSSIGDLQRLSTPSYVVNRNKIDATRWRWYRNDGSDQQPDWKPYEDNQAPYQDVLESKYLEDKQQNACFQISHVDYVIGFATMIQTTVVTNVKRDIRRRPIFFTAIETMPVVEQLPAIVYTFSPFMLPAGEGWSPMNTELPGYADIVPVNCVSKYNEIIEEFYKTMSREEYSIRVVYRIQNLTTWKYYNSRKSQLLTEAVSRSQPHSTSSSPVAVPAKLVASERRLFYGLPGGWPLVVRLARQNIDPRSEDRQPTPYGIGAGFSVAAGRVSRFGHSTTRRDLGTGLRYVLLARVLVGRSTRGLPFMKGPSPHDDSSSNASYDSTVDDMNNPTEFVVFDRRHIYPEYVIAYDNLHAKVASSCVLL